MVPRPKYVLTAKTAKSLVIVKKSGLFSGFFLSFFDGWGDLFKDGIQLVSGALFHIPLLH